MDWEMALSRRTFLKTAGAGALSIWLPACVSRAPAHLSSPGQVSRDFFPIDRAVADVLSTEFSGDSVPAKAHELLWDKEGFLARHPGAAAGSSEEAPLVIVGGGIAGLTTAYLLRDLKPIVLEQAPRFGGNSRGESWRGMDYSIGAAYFGVPEQGSALHHLLVDELEVEQYCVKRTSEDPVLLSGQFKKDIWPPKLRNYLKQVAKHSFPAIPATTAAEWKVLRKLDQETLLEHLERNLGKIEEPLFTAIEHYCWSSFGASSMEMSAAAGLNFLVSEFEPIYVPRGGNAAVAERLVKKLQASVGVSLRPEALVFDVKRFKEGPTVRYMDRTSKIREIHARAVVMACPKFIANKLIDVMEPARRKAIEKLRYRSYLVANVLCEGSLSKNFYDAFLLGNGKTDKTKIEDEARKQGATDVIANHFANPRKGEFVLTLYRAFPYDGARTELLAADAHAKYRAEMQAQLARDIFPSMGENLKVKDVRLARWGHPLPVAAKGLNSNGGVASLQNAMSDSVFFVEQDNWALPCLESAMGEALRQSPVIRKSLAREKEITRK